MHSHLPRFLVFFAFLLHVFGAICVTKENNSTTDVHVLCTQYFATKPTYYRNTMKERYLVFFSLHNVIEKLFIVRLPASGLDRQILKTFMEYVSAATV